MPEIVINNCYGGFGLSPEAQSMLAKMEGKKAYFYKQSKYSFKDGFDEFIRIDKPESDFLIFTLTKNLGEVTNDLPDGDHWFNTSDITRDNPNLIKLVKVLKERANGRFSSLKIVEIPDDIEWEIEEYDGLEWISEKHRTWE